MPCVPTWSVTFADGSPRIQAITDCQTAANLINGIAELTDNHFDPLLRRCAKCLLQFWKRGWKPRHDHDDYVAWLPRDCNKTADFLANIALQDQESFEWTQESISGASNLLLMIDGGFVHGKGSAAWCIFDVKDHGLLDLLHFGYLFLTSARSPFECEMIALCTGLYKVLTLGS